MINKNRPSSSLQAKRHHPLPGLTPVFMHEPNLPASQWVESKKTESSARESTDSRRSESQLKKMIRNMGLKVTGQRMLILDRLQAGNEHVTAQDLFEDVGRHDSSIGFATVYRFLRELTSAGLVTELRMGGASARYELAGVRHHDHLSCVKCGDIYEFENTQIEELQDRVAKDFGFVLKHHVLELYGVCPACQGDVKPHVTRV